MRKDIRSVVRKATRNLRELRGTVQLNLTLPITEVLAETKWRVEQLAAEAGLKLIACTIQEEVRQLAGQRYERRAEAVGHRWGSQPGYVMFAGRKARVGRPRVRHKETGREMALESYGKFQQDQRLEQAVMDQMALGLSTRNYEASIQAFCDGYGIKKSSVSRHFMAASKKSLDELMNRRLEQWDLVVLFIDGIERGGECLIVAVGVDSEGNKHSLGLWQGATENGPVCGALLDNLVDRGLDPENQYLFILDGSKALSSAIRRKFAGSEIQRCQWHKRRNVLEHLPESHQADVERHLKAAYAMTGYREAQAALCDVLEELEQLNPSAARSLAEGMEETLTLHRLAIPEQLRVSLRTTNIIESSLSRVDELTRRVKRWRAGNHRQRWFATALLLAEKKFRKVRGYRAMKVLIQALRRPLAQKAAA
jgi:putative transposase